MASSISMASGISSEQLTHGTSSGKINGKKVVYIVASSLIVLAVVGLIALITTKSIKKNHVKELCADKTKAKECTEAKRNVTKEVVSKGGSLIASCIPPVNPACIAAISTGFARELL